ncbi:protein phosphatase 1 regulatory subunit 37 [Xyrauchen texanus]|uniref:protein phosphatase 1 regulatory subunit 37 n=1 Tax=Xyrauchen texanus TaxID=154827 RepID=UPI0022425D66|nr:protein phosphatase 1 regulatory subunit 37 [Xyrauchen texanus]
MNLRNGPQIFRNLPSELFSSFDVSTPLDGMVFDERGVNAFGDWMLVDYAVQALSKTLLTSRLTVLHLENTCLSGKPLFTLVGALKWNAALHLIHLFNALQLNGYQDSMQLGELLKYNNTLKTLDLSDSITSDSGLEEICDALSFQKAGLRTLILNAVNLVEIRTENLQIQRLDVWHNQVLAGGLVALSLALKINHSSSDWT